MPARRTPRVRQVSCSPVRRMADGRDPARRRRGLSRHPPAGADQRLGRGRAGRPPGIRQLRRRRPRHLRDLSRPGLLAGRRRRGAAPGAGQPASVPAPAGEMPVVLGPGLARRAAARGDRPRPGGRLQPQEDLRLRRPDGPARRGAGRHRGRRRHHRRPARLALHRRRGHADRRAPC